MCDRSFACQNPALRRQIGRKTANPRDLTHLTLNSAQFEKAAIVRKKNSRANLKSRLTEFSRAYYRQIIKRREFCEGTGIRFKRRLITEHKFLTETQRARLRGKGLLLPLLKNFRPKFQRETVNLPHSSSHNALELACEKSLI